MRRRQILAQAAKPSPVPKPRDIRAEYIAKFGKPPHGRMKPETIKARLDDDDTVNGSA